MLSDISIMVWKEWKELLQFQGGKRSGFTSLLVMMLVFGIFMPIQWGNLWTDTAAPLSLWVVMPLLLVGMMVADSIAGERERHTLETLLATRLSDQSILLGKISASITYVWVVTQLTILVALIPVNVMHGQGKILFYTPKVAMSGMLLSLLLACLMSNIGVLISLRAETVKQAQQQLGVSVFVVAYLVPMAGVYALRFVPEETKNRIVQPILSGDIDSIALLASAGLILLNVGLFAVSSGHFQRTRLINNQ